MTNTETKNIPVAASKRYGFASSVTSVLLLALILVVINYIAGFMAFRADMSAEKLFTLSAGTLSMLGKLGDKVKLKFYFSETVANVPFGYKLYGKRIREFLDEYAANSSGMVELEINDPKPDTDTEEWAVKYGLAQAALPTGEKFYLGMVAVVADKEEIIPFFNIEREEFLEYDITRAIYQASAVGKPVVGIMSPLPIVGTPPTPFPMPNVQKTEDWLFLRELRKNYDVRKIDIDATEIPGDISLLMVVHPKNFSESALYAIDQYVLKGGRAVIMVDPSCRADTQTDPGNPYFAAMSRSSNLPKLFEAWGVRYDASMLVADMNMATKVNFEQMGVFDHPLWLTLTGNSLVKESVISGKLANMMMVDVGALSKVQGSEHEFTPILQTTEGANLIPLQKLMSMPDELLRGLPATGSRQVLAALVRGTFKSAFQEPPKSKPAEGASEEDKKAAEGAYEELRKKMVSKADKQVSVMILADSDFLQNDYCVRAINFFGSMLLQPLNDNLAFISNTVDFLAGSEDLIAVRSRGKFSRTFTRVENIEREAQKKWQEEEKALTNRLEEIQNRINQLQAQKKDGERLILSAEQREEIMKARDEKTETMRRRREIRKLLRYDIERLGTLVTFANLLLMPLIVTAVGVVVYRRQNSERGMQ